MSATPALSTEPHPGKKGSGGARAGAGRKPKEGAKLSKFGEAVKAKGWGSTRLGKELGCSASSASTYMYGQQRPEPEIMGKIAEIFGEEFGLRYWLTIPKRVRN